MRNRSTKMVMIMLVLAMSFGTQAALAWDAHDVITYQAVKDMSGLAFFEAIEITPYTYGDLDGSQYNPAFELEYKLGNIGDRVSAVDILKTYAPEPDWDLDTDLDLSPRQNMTGGSQGWRHQRYTLFNGLIVLGVAPERAEHFYNLALTAYERGDLYWAFRFLARSAHYLQDLGQPLHALPLPVGDLIFKHRFSIDAADAIATNVHYSIEAYYDYHLQEQSEQAPVLFQALQGTEQAPIGNLAEYAEGENMRARKQAGKMYDLVLEIWPEIDVTVDKRIAKEDYDRSEPDAKLTELWNLVAERLSATAANTRGLVTKFLEEAAE